MNDTSFAVCLFPVANGALFMQKNKKNKDVIGLRVLSADNG